MISCNVEKLLMKTLANENGVQVEQALDTVYVIANSADRGGFILQQDRLDLAIGGLQGHQLPCCIFS